MLLNGFFDFLHLSGPDIGRINGLIQSLQKTPHGSGSSCLGKEG